jgi:hypothetical protein
VVQGSPHCTGNRRTPENHEDRLHIITHAVTDPQKFAREYIAGFLPFLEKYKAEVVVADMQAIRDWPADPDYQPSSSASASPRTPMR